MLTLCKMVFLNVSTLFSASAREDTAAIAPDLVSRFRYGPSGSFASGCSGRRRAGSVRLAAPTAALSMASSVRLEHATRPAGRLGDPKAALLSFRICHAHNRGCISLMCFSHSHSMLQRKSRYKYCV